VVLTGWQGTVPTVDKLGGKWAVPGVGYGGFIARILDEILSVPDPGTLNQEDLRQQIEALAAERDSLKQGIAVLEAEKKELVRNTLALIADNERLTAVVSKVREAVGS
jgi:cell division protein FtsB